MTKKKKKTWQERVGEGIKWRQNKNNHREIHDTKSEEGVYPSKSRRRKNISRKYETRGNSYLNFFFLTLKNQAVESFISLSPFSAPPPPPQRLLLLKLVLFCSRISFIFFSLHLLYWLKKLPVSFRFPSSPSGLS